MTTSMLRNKNHRGQAILFVVVAVTIALALGVSIASRTLLSASRAAKTDTASRVLAAAEGGIENFLAFSDSDLSWIANDPFDCKQYGAKNPSGECVITFTAAGDNITALAYVKVGAFGINYPAPIPDHYRFDIKGGATKEVNLDGYMGSSVKICWSNTGSTTPPPDTAIRYTIYNQTGVLKRGGIIGSSSTHIAEVSGFDETSSGNDTYPLCLSPIAVTDAYGIRLRVLYGDAIVAVYPASASVLPFQGFKIVSRGELLQAGAVKVTKVVRVYRSLPYLPSVFDYAVYSTGNLD